jgi:peptidoglycan hydrolase-like protein with peptidoglycan-binding domain
MPLKFWDETFVAATYLINRVPSKTIQYQAPLQHLYQVKPNYSSLRIFGCACWPNLTPTTKENSSFAPKNVFSLDTATFIKGSNVWMLALVASIFLGMLSLMKVFFPFAKLHPNAGVRLRSEILLLPPSLIPPESLHNGVNNLGEPVTNFPHPININYGSSTRVQVADFSRPDCIGSPVNADPVDFRPDCIGSPANANPVDSRPDCIDSPVNVDPADSRPDCIGSPASSAPTTSALPIAGTGMGHMTHASSSSQQPAVQRPHT